MAHRTLQPSEAVYDSAADYRAGPQGAFFVAFEGGRPFIEPLESGKSDSRGI